MKDMKKIIVMSCLVFASAFNAIAQDNKQSNNITPEERANRLSDQMIRELKLNNFQANRLRAINQEKIGKMADIEQKYAANPVLVDKNCKGVCKERDNELESFLSTDQYSVYYGARTKYYKYDKDFAAQIGAESTVASASSEEKPALPVGKKVVPVKRNTAVVTAGVSK
jgi:ABC-type transporter MlaC component